MSGQNHCPHHPEILLRSQQRAGVDEAEAEGTPLEVTPVDPAERVTRAMPLDQTVVSFD